METQITEYTIFNRYLSDCLKDSWKDERDELLELYPKLSTQRAGDLIAAYFAVLAAREWTQLEQEVRGAREENAATRTYDELVDRSINGDLVDMSKTRTLIADIDKIEQAEKRIKSEAAYLWKALYYIAQVESWTS